MKTQFEKTLSLKLMKHQFEDVEKLAKKKAVSNATIIRLAIFEFIKKNKMENKK